MTTERADLFHTTSWGLVQAAAGDDTAESRQALTRLCEAYWRPLYAYVRRHGQDVADAQDLTQTFFARLLEKDALRNLTPGAGRFRSFLLTALKNLMSDEFQRERALKRGAGRPTILLDFNAAESGYRVEPTDSSTPDLLYQKRWAATVLQRVLDRMRAQAERDGKSWEFERLKTYLTGDRPAPTYRQVAEELEMTEDAVKMAIHRLRKRFGNVLRAEIGETVASENEIDDEIRYLLSVLRE